MAWLLVGSTSAAITAGAGTQNITLPNSPIQGDLVLVATAADISCQNCVTTAGYTVPENATGANPGANFAYKVMGASPDTIVTIDQDATLLRAVVVQVWRGGRATILDAAWITPLTGTSANPNAGAIVTTTPNALIVQVAFLDDDDTTATAPANYTNTITTNTGQSSTTIGSTVAIATRILAAAASEDAGNWTMGSSDAWSASAIAFAVAALGPTNALTEAINVSDTVTATIPTPGLDTGLLTENLKISESLATLLNPLSAAPTEHLLLDDIGQGQTQIIAPIRVQDVLTISITPIFTSQSESIRVTDSATGSINIDVSKQEDIKVVDTATVTITPVTVALQEDIKVSDTATVTITPILVALQENVLVTDTATANQGLAITHQENILVTDSLTPPVLSGGGDLTTGTLTENVLIDDIGQGQTQLLAPIRVQDILTVAMVGDFSVSLTESIKVSDAVTTSQLDLSVSRTESIRVVDASDSWAELETPELILIRDTVSVLLNPLQATPQENIKVSDSVTASVGGLAPGTLTESVLVTDTVTARLTLLLASASEAVLVADIVTTRINPLRLTLQEDVKVSDSAQASFGLTAAVTTEQVLVSDSLTVAMTLRVALSESVLVSDQSPPQAQLVNLGNLDVTKTEDVTVSDTLTVTITPLFVTLSEDLLLSENGNHILGAGALLLEPVLVTETLDLTLNPLETSLTESVLVEDVRRSIGIRITVRDVTMVTASVINVTMTTATIRDVEVV